MLLVEDNPINQKVAMHMLKRLNCEVELAEDGAIALDMIENKDYAIIFMDVQMPRVDGLEATAEIRRREMFAGKHRIIIAMTANAMVGDREKCLAAGMDDYISKPVLPPELARMIEKWTVGEAAKAC